MSLSIRLASIENQSKLMQPLLGCSAGKAGAAYWSLPLDNRAAEHGASRVVPRELK